MKHAACATTLHNKNVNMERHVFIHFFNMGTCPYVHRMVFVTSLHVAYHIENFVNIMLEPL